MMIACLMKMAARGASEALEAFPDGLWPPEAILTAIATLSLTHFG